MPWSKDFAIEMAVVMLATLAASLAAILICLMLFAPRAHAKDEFSMPAWDRPMMDYPEYMEMMQLGATTVDFDGRDIIVYKSDFTIKELQQLGIALRAM